jgi:hypothetical protein
VRKRFLRIKETLYVLREAQDNPRCTREVPRVRPEESLVLEKGELGDFILKDDSLILTFREPCSREEPAGRLAWDSNETSLDSFNPDLVHKLTTELAGSFPNAEHRFERLEKRGMFNGSRAHNRRLVKADWSTLDALLQGEGW